MKIVREHDCHSIVEAPQAPSISDVRRIARFFRRGGLEAEFETFQPDERGEPETCIRHLRLGSYAGPLAWCLTLSRGEFMRTVEDKHPYAVLDFDSMWQAAEAMGFSVSCLGHGDWTEGRYYEVDALNPNGREERCPFLVGRGPTRVAAMFALCWGLERLTRNWRMGCGRSGLSRPWAHRNRRDQR